LTVLEIQNKRRDKLDCIESWDSKDFEIELSNFEETEILDLWVLLEPSFRNICRRYGLLSPSQRVSVYGMRLNRLIKNLGIIQEKVSEIENSSPKCGDLK